MIYKVSGHLDSPVYFDEASNPNAKAEAEVLLKQKQQEVLSSEASRFSICATFVNNNDTTWREVLDTDPEETICQVFDHTTGTYTQVNTKTEATTLNDQKKQDFLRLIKLDMVYEVNEIPTKQTYNLGIYGSTVGDIPVEVM